MANNRDTRSSYPPTAYGHSYAPTDRDSFNSSIFQYSTTRPPTNYSAQSWLPQRKRGSSTPGLPPLPASQSGIGAQEPKENPFVDGTRWSDDELEGEGDDRDTPLYARSDWASEQPTAQTGGAGRRWSEGSARWREEKTAWTQSSWAGELRDIPEEGESEEHDSRNGQGTGLAYEAYEDEDEEERGVGEQGGGGFGWGVVDSPMSIPTGHSRPSSGVRPDRASQTGQNHRQTLIPSVLSLGQLMGKPPSNPFRANTNPFADPPSPSQAQGVSHRRSYSVQHTPSFEAGARFDTSPKEKEAVLISPSAQQRLGRMSVAQPRYSLPLRRGVRGKAPVLVSGGSGQANSGLGRTYATYRPFMVAGTSLVAALLCTITLSTARSIGSVVKLQEGAFVVEPESGAMILGVVGWCVDETSGSTCSGYQEGDFVNSSADFRLPGDESLLPTLANLFTALTTLTWLLATFQLVTALLHAVLFFGLSLPFDHLVTSSVPLHRRRNSKDEKAALHHSDGLEDGTNEGETRLDEVQMEVDLRVRCERPPFESYGWVWWAWWAHRRGPVGEVFATAVAFVGLCALGVAVGFEREVANAADTSGSVSFGAGTFVPLVVLILTADNTVRALRFWSHPKSSMITFLNPPLPSPTALLLPSLPLMRRTINSTGSFFAPRTTLPPLTAGPDLMAFTDTSAPPLPIDPSELDPETIRWLAAYPSDEDLVPLIASLRSGRDNEDFVLSDVGLLYLKPEEGEDENALLVPPHGVIRRELLEDAHLELLEGEEGGGSAHWGPQTMLGKLEETFWWPDLDLDVEAFVSQCAVCVGNGTREDERVERELKPGMTPVPFTGVTGWTGMDTGVLQRGVGESAMAAEMAFAQRKAEEEVQRDALG